MGEEGTSVVENECCSGSQTGDEPMPHHPGGGCIEKESIAREYVAMEDVLFFVLNKGTERRMYDTFWLSSGPGRVKNVNWVAWWKGDEFFGVFF